MRREKGERERERERGGRGSIYEIFEHNDYLIVPQCSN